MAEDLSLLSKPISLDPYLTNPRAFTPHAGLRPYDALGVSLRHACSVSLFDEESLRVLQGKSYAECQRMAEEQIEEELSSTGSTMDELPQPTSSHGSSREIAREFFQSVSKRHGISPAGVDVLSNTIPLGSINVLFHSGNEYSVLYRHPQDECLYLLLSSSMSPLHTWIKLVDYGNLGDDATRYDERFMHREMRMDRKLSHGDIKSM